MFGTLLTNLGSLFHEALAFLDYGSEGILVLVLLLWFIERRETIKRFEKVLKESAAADLEVAKALSAVSTVITVHGWWDSEDTDD